MEDLMFKPAEIGDRIKIRGQWGQIFKIRPAGTVDVETADRVYRVSGLPTDEHGHPLLTAVPL